ncbi:TssQ family T6SS-associated lipoprotein [Variovorax sp.]|uniref:TssQ family T6SS-associated lipoprotein n=1 Tax=Variovorax sp. TaxID=1871043 RepID=UPI0025E2DC34|nr:TssQ family T6SS-associated lipoprotein [Variovorax sp.]
MSQQVARTTLERAQQAYDDGDYAKAISTLKSGGVSVFDAAEPTTRLAAMKLEAFSYCVANQLPECRTQFLKILDAFPSFDLSIAERKHPVWGPAFEAAKKMKR